MLGIGGACADANALLVQPDGVILLAGRAGPTKRHHLVLTRLHANGEPDREFGDGGTVTTAFGATHAEAFGLARQSSGRIVVVAKVADMIDPRFRVPDSMVLAGFTTRGALDKTFATVVRRSCRFLP